MQKLNARWKFWFEGPTKSSPVLCGSMLRNCVKVSNGVEQTTKLDIERLLEMAIELHEDAGP